jgi:hypothetical protein
LSAARCWAFGSGQLLGLDIFAPGYGGASIGGIVLVGLGGGVGLQVARRWRARKITPKQKKD